MVNGKQDQPEPRGSVLRRNWSPMRKSYPMIRRCLDSRSPSPSG